MTRFVIEVGVGRTTGLQRLPIEASGCGVQLGRKAGRRVRGGGVGRFGSFGGAWRLSRCQSCQGTASGLHRALSQGHFSGRTPRHRQPASSVTCPTRVGATSSITHHEVRCSRMSGCNRRNWRGNSRRGAADRATRHVRLLFLNSKLPRHESWVRTCPPSLAPDLGRRG
jgi:hypothetical protein